MAGTKKIKIDELWPRGWQGTTPIPAEGELVSCQGIFGWLLGHNYEHMFHDEFGPGGIPSPEALFHRACGEEVSSIIAASRSHKRTYVHSICSRCGHVVKISSSPS